MIEAARRRAVANGDVLPDSNTFGGSISSNDNKGEQENTVFLLPQMFQLQPSTEVALVIDNHHSLSTNATGVSTTTTEIIKAVANTPFPVINITDDDNNTYISGVTTATALLSPPTSTESSSFPAPKLGVLRQPSYGR